MEYNVNTLVESRLKLAELRNSLRIYKSNIESSKFKIEQNAIQSVDGNYGKNSEERERFLKNALFESDSYVDLENRIISVQNEIELEEAKLDALRDLRRDLDMLQKDRLIEANINI